MGGLRVTMESNPTQRRATDLALQVNGAQELLLARLKEFGALCSMGHFRATDDVRNQAHVLLDQFLDASMDQSRFNREVAGLK